MVRTIPIYAESTIENAAAIAGNVAVIKRGQISFADKVRKAMEAGAVGVLITNDDEDDPDKMPGFPFISPGPGDSLPIPSFCVSFSTGQNIKEGSRGVFVGECTELVHEFRNNILFKEVYLRT